MSQNIETVSIDLTEDDIEGQQPQIKFPDYHSINCHNGEKPTPQENNDIFQSNRALNKCHDYILSENEKPIDSLDISAVNFIENLQKENPQIETVFIESDEDDIQTKAPIFIHNRIILKSPQSTTKGNEKKLLTNSEATCKLTTKIKSHTLVKKSLNQINQVPPLSSPSIIRKTANETLTQMASPHLTKNKGPFTARPISPSSLNQKLIKNSSTIALEDVTDKSLSRKYLIIPKEVEPLLVNSQTPISLTVPGIGPLLIPKPSDMFKPQTTITPRNFKNITHESPYDPLTDSKYCWRYQRKRKRDLDGFLITDRLGFYRAEQQRTRMCATKYQQIIKKLQLSINIKQRAFVAIKNHRLNMENIKLVDVDSIKTGKKKNTLQSRKREQKLHFSRKHNISPIELSSSESDGELLVTKKVVIIKETGTGRGRKYTKHLLGKQHRKKQREKYHNNQDLQVATVDSKRIKSKTSYTLQNVVVKRGRPRKKEKIVHKGSKYKIQRRQTKGKSSELSEIELGKQFFNNDGIHNIKPCRVEITHDNLVQNALQKYSDYTLKSTKHLVNTCKIIDTLKQFQKEIQPMKPILVINEDHCSKMDIQEILCKYNVVFPMSEITNILDLNIRNMAFVDSAKAGYIKFVKPHILGKYFAGFRDR